MAEITQARDRDGVGVEDVFGVRNRISWSAILAGAVVGIAMYMLLILLGAAIGLSVDEAADDDTLGWGAVIWSIVASMLAMFVGGWIASLCTAGESHREAAIYGVVTWAVALGIMLWLVAAGVGAGLNAMMGLASVDASSVDDGDWAAAARRAGINADTVNQWQQSVQNAPAAANQAAQQPANQQAVEDAAEKASWGALAGMALSLAAAIGGAMVGAGPAFRLAVAVPTVPRTAAGRFTTAH
jgi:hypothetical protein